MSYLKVLDNFLKSNRKQPLFRLLLQIFNYNGIIIEVLCNLNFHFFPQHLDAPKKRKRMPLIG